MVRLAGLRGPLVASAMGCGLAACSLLVGNDLTGGGETPGPNVTADGSVASPSDGGPAASAEAGTSADAASDAAPPCAAKFCDSFEPPAAFGAGWDQIEGTGGTLAYDGPIATTGTRSLLATVAPGAPYRRLFLAKSVGAGLATELRASASLRVERREAGTTNDLLDVYFTPPAGFTSYDVWVIAGGDGSLTLKGGAVPTAGAASYPNTTVPGLPLDAFTRLELVVRYEAAKVTAELLVAGASRAVIALPLVPPGSLRVAVGAPETGGTTKQGWTIRTDDVAIDWH